MVCLKTLPFQRWFHALQHHGSGLVPLQNQLRVMDEVLLFERCLTFEKWTGKVYRSVASIYEDFSDVQIGDSNRNHHWVVLLRIDSREIGIYEHYWGD